MWKFLLGAAVLIALGEAQRSSYAPRPGSNSKLLPKFRQNQTQATTNRNLSTRGGEEESTPNSSLPPEFQGTLEDLKFVQRVSQWPEDRQPFWFKNRYAISSMRSRPIDGGDANQRQPPVVQRSVLQFQSPFFGPSNTRRPVDSNSPADIPNQGQIFLPFRRSQSSYF